MASSPPLTATVKAQVEEVPTRGRLSHEQVTQLLNPINDTRVLESTGHSHVSQQDIRAHLIRVFGFGGYDAEVLDVSLVFEQEGQGEKNGNRYPVWTVCYRALVRLTIRNEHGELVAFYEDGSTATAQKQPQRGDAHDLAYKSAISLSVKRAAIALGDQFGLSLYNKGQRAPLVIGTMVAGAGAPEVKPPEDLQANVPQQVALGNDEADVSLDGTEAGVAYGEAPEPTVNEAGEVTDEAWYLRAVEEATEEATLRDYWESARTAGVLTQSVKNAIMEKKAVLDHEANRPAPAEPEAAPEAPAAEEPPAEPKAATATRKKA